jgi:hypothetical protein
MTSNREIAAMIAQMMKDWNNATEAQRQAISASAKALADAAEARMLAKGLTRDERDGGARFEAVQNAGIDY